MVARIPVNLVDGKFYLHYLEMDVSFACNLQCSGCSHYSNYRLSGVISLADAREWMSAWSRRIQPERIRLLGGEPAINPELSNIVRAAAEFFPTSIRAVVSNGLLLHKRQDIFSTLRDTNTQLHISVHDRTEKTSSCVANIQKISAELGIHCIISGAQPEEFHHLYRGEGKDILPFDHKDSTGSWDLCAEKNCVTIHEGLIWKCPPLAFLGLLNKKIKLNVEWEPYLKHRGLPITATDKEIFNYLSYPEADCAMCPAHG